MEVGLAMMTGFKTLAIIAALFMTAFMIIPPAAFAQPAPSCFSHVTTSTTLTSDLTGCGAIGLYLNANNITLDCAGHWINGTNSPFSAGIDSVGYTGITIKNCNVSGFYQGIYTDFSSNENIASNNLAGNSFGIFVQRSSGITMTGNTADGNSQVGVFLGASASGNNLTGNTANGNSQAGFEVSGNSGNNVTANTADNNGYYGYWDTTTGSDTSGTANTYLSNVCIGDTSAGSYPGGLCGSPTYSVTFDQGGIPNSGATWGVTVGSAHYTGTGPSIAVSGISGTSAYAYDSPVAGSAGTRYTCNTGCTGSVSGTGVESAGYSTQYLLTVATNPPGLTPAPTASPSSLSGYYDSGTPVMLTANTVSGYSFINWKIDGTGQPLLANTTDVTMNGPHNGTAVYVQPTNGTVTGGGAIGNGTDFGFEVHSDLNRADPMHGTFEYHDRHVRMDLESNSISFLSVDPTETQAMFVGVGTHDRHDKDGAHATAYTFLVSVTDPDKKGDHDTLSITVTNSTGNVIYQNSGNVHGHIEIHNVDHDTHGGHSDNDNTSHDNNDGKN